MKRCLNIDWLEVYCLEDSFTFPHDANFFRNRGWQVVERDYGTPVYAEMFTLYGHDGEPFLEIRRSPKSAQGKQLRGLFDPLGCHIRLHNRTCYFADPAQCLVDFVNQYGFTVSRIARIDLCLDFERFDYGDDPQIFLQRYLANRYAKINQANIANRGRDSWDGRVWNSIAWGENKSMVRTKLYNKTLELAQVHDKPYIRQAWQAAGLVDDAKTLSKRKDDGTEYMPVIWRLEFSIKSGTRGWFVIEDWNGKKKNKVYQEHTLPMYSNKQTTLSVFFSLVHHYFHFKRVEYMNESRRAVSEALSAIKVDYSHQLNEYVPQRERKRQRKDRCTDKLLFKFDDIAEFYKIPNVATATPSKKAFDKLLKMIVEYRETHLSPHIFKACNVLIEDIEFIRRADDLPIPWSADELTLIRLLVAKRMRNHDAPLANDIAEVKALIQVSDNLFGEVDTKPQKKGGTVVPPSDFQNKKP